jgi:hypothetical protein
MSIYASNYIVDELTGEAKLVKHLNKSRIDRGAYNSTPGGWNKSGKKARQRKRSNIFNKRTRVYSKKIKMENF